MESRRHFMAGIGITMFMVLGLLGYLIWDGYREAIAAARTTMSNYAAIVETRLDATLRRADAVTQEMLRVLPEEAFNRKAGAAKDRKIDHLFDLQRVNFEELGSLRVFDRDGDVLYTTEAATSLRTNIVDRAFFVKLMNSPETGIAYEATTSRANGRPILVLARGIFDRSGVFRGVVAASIELEVFQKLFRSLDLGAGGAMVMRRSDDFSVVTRWTQAAGTYLERSALDSPIRQAMARGESSGSFEFARPGDGSIAIFGFHRLSRYPFYIGASVPRSQVLAGWRARALSLGVVALILMGLLGYLLANIRRADARASRVVTDLTASEEHTRLILDSSMDAVIELNADGNVTAWTAAAAQIFGHPADHTIGRNFADLVIPSSRNTSHHQRLRHFLSSAAGGNSNRRIEIPALRADGQNIVVELSLARILRGDMLFYSAFARDITAAKRAAEEVLTSKAKLEAALASMSDAIFITDAAGRFVHINAALATFHRFRNIDDFAKTLAESPNFLEVYSPEGKHLPVSQRAMQRALRGETASGIEFVMKRNDTGESWVGSYSYAPILDSEGEIVGTVVTARDVTEQKNAAATHERLQTQLRQSQKMEAVGLLAGGIAHDFNNIIAAILGNTDLAEQDAAANPRALESLAEIRHAGVRARALVQQILSFGRRQQTQLLPMPLQPVIEESARLLRAMLPTRVTLLVECAKDVPAVMVDATQIEQVVLNLATNSLHAMHGRTGTIGILLDQIDIGPAMLSAHPQLQRLAKEKPGSLVCLTVKDDGAGMDAATLARIFEPFFTTKPVGEGTGLGLSVVHGVVQTHGGEIVVESHAGIGTVFHIFLPPSGVAEPAAVAPPPKTLEAAPDTAPATASRILYLDDEESMVFLVKRLLERRGHQVTGFTDQKEAIAAVRADPYAFDLVLTDYNMPVLTGLDVAREMRAIRADLPVAIASGFVDESLREQAGGAGVRDLIFKASQVSEYCSSIERLLPTANKAELVA